MPAAAGPEAARTRLRQFAYGVVDNLKQAQPVLTTFRDAKLLKGKYRDRIGKIGGMTVDPHHGLLILVYLYKIGKDKKPTGEILNSDDSHTRSYWPMSDLELIPRPIDPKVSTLEKE